MGYQTDNNSQLPILAPTKSKNDLRSSSDHLKYSSTKQKD